MAVALRCRLSRVVVENAGSGSLLVTNSTCRCKSGVASDPTGMAPMTKLELVIQLLKIALGIAIGGYFLWWSLEVLQRLPPHQ
jgi:hypothetical protein